MLVHKDPCLIERPHERTAIRPAQPRCMYPDEYLHHYADRFVRLDLSQYVTLAEYLAQPNACEAYARRRKHADRVRNITEGLRREATRRRRCGIEEIRVGPESPPETIGPCEWCGLVDHHLIAGECPDCRERSETRLS